jgi:hypothetical protein
MRAIVRYSQSIFVPPMGEYRTLKFPVRLKNTT